MQRRLKNFRPREFMSGRKTAGTGGRRFGPERAEAVKKGQTKLAFFAPFAA